MSPSPPAASPARRVRRWLLRLFILVVCIVVAGVVWNSPIAESPRALWRLSQMPAPTALPVPVAGVAARQVADTFGAPRGRDRTHAGVDIFAKRGTEVRSATPGIVADIRESGLGGRQVWVMGPARERYYYAHLDDWRDGLARATSSSRARCWGTSVTPATQKARRRICTGASTVPTAPTIRCPC